MILDLDKFLIERAHLAYSGAWLKPRPAPPPSQPVAPRRWPMPIRKTRAWAARAKWGALARELPRTIPLTAKARRAVVRVMWMSDLHFHDLSGPDRWRHIARARTAAIIAVAHAQPALSSVQIGKMFNRHHTTVLLHLGRTAGAKRKLAAKRGMA